MPSKNIKAELITKINCRSAAAREILVIAVGLGLTTTLADKFRQITSQQTPSADLTSVLFLIVFIIYSVRFFVNNWTYLSESYEARRLEDENEEVLWIVFGNAAMDLFLNIFTGMIVVVASIMLEPSKIHYLLACIVIHYLIDAAILFRNYTIMLAKVQEYEPDRQRVIWWIVNNSWFIIYALVQTGVMWGSLQDGKPPGSFTTFLVLSVWLVNCILAVAITWFFRPRHTQGETVGA